MSSNSKTKIVKGLVECDVSLNQKTVVITGCNTGIGFENALEMAKRGARVLMACRDAKRAEDAKAKILEQVKDAGLVIKILDLSSLESVRACAKDINETESRLDILINNAGLSMCPRWKTKEGYDMQLGVNHIGHFLFTNLLLDLLKKSAPSRIVILSSWGHTFSDMKWNDLMSEKDYDPLQAYSQSKLANVLHGKELARRLEGTGVTTYVVHPGYVSTELERNVKNDNSHLPLKWRIFIPIYKLFHSPVSPKVGSQTTLYCSIAPELENVTGKYYADCKEKSPSAASQNVEDAKRLWELSEEWTKVVQAQQD